MPIFPILKRPKSGDKISASEYGLLVDAIDALQQAIKNPDGQFVQTILAKALLGSSADLLYPARISAVNVGTPHPNSLSGRPAYTPSTVTYNVRGIARPGLVLTAATPYYGRPVRYDEALIHPARVNDLCFIEVFRQASDGELVSRLGLIQNCEVIARKQCASES